MAGWNAEIDVVEHLRPIDAIAKRDVLENDAATDRWQRGTAGIKSRLGWRIEDVAKSRNREAGLMEILPRHRQIERARRGAGHCRSRIGGGEGVGAGRQGRRGKTPAAGAARRRGAKGATAAVRHTVDPAGAVPVRVTNSLAFSTPVLITGGGGFTVRLNGLDAALVTAEVDIGGGEGVGAGRPACSKAWRRAD